MIEKTVITLQLSKEEVQSAIMDYLLLKKVKIKRIDKIDSIINRVQIPGLDIHDCDWRDEFGGIEVTGS